MPIISFEPQGRVTSWNPAAELTFGWSEAEVLGMFLPTVSEQTWEEFEQLRARTMDGEPLSNREMCQAKRDGSWIDLQVSTSPLHDDQGHITGVMFTCLEITARKRTEEALRESEQRYREVFENANDIIYTVDLEGNFTSVNRMAEQVSGYTREQALSLNLAEIVAPEHLSLVRRMLAEKLDGLGSTVYELEIITRDGRRVPLEVSTRLIYEGDRPVGAQGIGRDISERKRTEAKLEALLAERSATLKVAEHRSSHDALTDLPNRTLLRDRLHDALGDAKREHTSLALFFLDVNRFKEVNDTFGHHYGDTLLQSMATRLQQSVRETDMVARLGGDEFAVLLPSTTGSEAAIVAEKIVVALSEPDEIEGHFFDLGASLGIALYPSHGDDASTLMRHADVAMYSAKRTGSDYVAYSPEQDENNPARLTLMSELRSAIQHDQLVLHYQPQVALKDGCADHVEALIRWDHPERGFLPPDSFIPLAEETGLIKPLTAWVLDQAARQCALWKQDGLDMQVAVNLSARSLHDHHVVDVIASLLARWDLKPSSIQIEITESTIIVDPECIAQTLTLLHDMGVQVSIDDFGTGYSSLAHLKRLPIDQIKVDRSFVMDMMTNKDNEFIVRSLIDLGHNLGLEVVAEGVETQATLHMLTLLGCDVVQGYYVSKPLPETDLLEWLRRRKESVLPHTLASL